MSIMLNTAVFEEEILNGKTQLQCLQALTPEVLQQLTAIEVRLEFFAKDTTIRQQEIIEIENFCHQNNFKLLLSIPEPLFKDNQINPAVIQNINTLKDYSFSNFKVSCGKLFSLTSNDIATLKELFNGHAYTISVENPPNENGTVTNVLDTLKLLNTHQIQAGYTFDAGNWYWIDLDPVVAYQKLLPYVTIFHLKSIENKTTILLSDTSNFAWKELVSLTPSNLPVVLEYNIPTDKISQEIAILQTLNS